MTTEPDIIESTPVYFAEEILGMRLYDWQATVLTWFEAAIGRRMQASLCTPNGAGKDSVVIAAIALWWVTVHKRGRVVITSMDARQIDEQTEPAIKKHIGKFPGWKFIERRVETPTGGKIILFTTDDPARCEGFHRETKADGTPDPDGPLLMIANEAKSISEEIFKAFDRCTYDAILYASSPGKMNGSFYESQFREELGFKRMRIGLKDCPHKTKEQIEAIRTKYGANSPYARSTLDGEFMEAEGEARFDLEGLEHLQAMVDVEENQPTAKIGRILEQERHRSPNTLQFVPDSAGWLWMGEAPQPGLAYIGWCDPMTGEQSEGAKVRDMHAAGIIRAPFLERRAGRNIEHDAEVVAVLHAKDGCRWYNDVLAERFDQLLRLYGDPTAIVEANNSGTEVMRLLTQSGRTLWRREKPNHRVPGKKMLDVVGFQTNAATKNLWIGALSSHISERRLVCRYGLAVSQFKTFIIDENGRGQAQDGCFLANTEILTELSCIPIQAIVKGMNVITHLGRPRQVGKVMVRDYSGEIINLKVSGIPSAIQVTPEHPFWGKRRTKNWSQNRKIRKPIESEWIEAGELRCGDWVSVPKRRNLPQSGLSDEQLYVVGFWIAEGHHIISTQTGAERGIGITNTDRAYLERCAKTLSAWFPRDVVRERGGLTHEFQEQSSAFKIDRRDRGKKPVFTLEFRSSFAAEYFRQFGGKQVTRHLGPLYGCSGLMPLLSGLIDGDGSHRKGQWKDASIFSTSEMQMRQIWQILIDHGVWSTRYKVPIRAANHEPCWVVNIKASFFSRLFPSKIQPVTHKHTVQHVIEDDLAFYTPVRGCERSSYQGDVFNFSVEEDESYVAGGVAVHNCHDDFVTGVGLGLFAMPAAIPMSPPDDVWTGDDYAGSGHFREIGSPFS